MGMSCLEERHKSRAWWGEERGLCQEALRDAKEDKKKAEMKIQRNSPTRRSQKTEGNLEKRQRIQGSQRCRGSKEEWQED